MCRICGRVVKCIFDTMPSRVYHVPSRRAFSTIQRASVSSRTYSAISATRSSTPSLTRAFSALSIRPTASVLSGTSVRPSLQSGVPASNPVAAQFRSFSASATLGAKRDTYDPSRRVQKRRHGFLNRIKTRGGRALIKRRRLKNRSSVSW